MIQDAALIALFQSGAPFAMADLYTFTLLNGTVLRITGADVPIKVGANTFNTSPLLSRDAIKLVAGLEVDDTTVTFYPAAGDMVGNVPLSAAAFRGLFDGAQYLHERAFFSPTWSDYVSKIIRFSGTVQDVQAGGRTQIPMTIKSDLFLLNVKLPRDIYQPGCRRTLYDADCGIDKAAFGIASSVTSGTATVINSPISKADGWFDLGTVTFTSGANAGVSRTVKEFHSGQFTFSLFWPYPPQVGDSFIAYAGCDKCMSTCEGKFDNLARFSAEPFVPAAEVAF